MPPLRPTATIGHAVYHGQPVARFFAEEHSGDEERFFVAGHEYRGKPASALSLRSPEAAAGSVFPYVWQATDGLAGSA